MAEKKAEINLLPARWKLPSSLRRFERRLKIASLGLLGAYLLGVVGMFLWFGYITVRRNSIASSVQNAGKELSALKQIEAKEAILKDKVAFAQSLFSKQVNVSSAIVRIMVTAPLGNLELQDLGGDSRGKVSLTGIAPSAQQMSSLFDTFEDPSGTARKMIQGGIGSFDLGANAKIQFKLDLMLRPENAGVSL